MGGSTAALYVGIMALYLLKYSTSRSVSSISTLSRSMSLGRNTSSTKKKDDTMLDSMGREEGERKKLEEAA